MRTHKGQSAFVCETCVMAYFAASEPLSHQFRPPPLPPCLQLSCPINLLFLFFGSPLTFRNPVRARPARIKYQSLLHPSAAASFSVAPLLAGIFRRAFLSPPLCFLFFASCINSCLSTLFLPGSALPSPSVLLSSGSAACTSCPDNSGSALGGSALSDCECVSGYGVSDAGDCPYLDCWSVLCLFIFPYCCCQRC